MGGRDPVLRAGNALLYTVKVTSPIKVGCITSLWDSLFVNISHQVKKRLDTGLAHCFWNCLPSALS
jgi:hypothetical protein